MPLKNQAMVINKTIKDNFKIYELISIDAFNKKPYTIYSKAFSVFDYLVSGSIVEQHGDTWIEILPYKEHSFEYATIYGIESDRMQVYGNKIGLQTIDKNLTKNGTLDKPIFEFHRGDKLLLEIDKRIHIVHNINQAKLIYEMQQNGPKVH